MWTVWTVVDTFLFTFASECDRLDLHFSVNIYNYIYLYCYIYNILYISILIINN